MTDGGPSTKEREFLESITEDGWPLVILGTGLEESSLEELQTLALSVVRQRLAGVYDDAGHVPLEQAEAIISEPKNWHALENEITWMISTTKAGAGAIGAPDEWWPRD